MKITMIIPIYNESKTIGPMLTQLEQLSGDWEILFADGGSAAEPYLMAQVKNGGDITYKAKLNSTGRLMSAETARMVKDYMRNNVQQVYGDWNFPGLRVCAKSGTSQLGGGKTSNAMFAGFLADAQYPFAFIVAVEDAGYGKTVCVPILSKVLAACKTAIDAQ